jgi:uncharacterized cofD-like protein
VSQSQPGELRIVALGGGHGLSTLLRGLKRCFADAYELSATLTAIVTVADDGGSSGRLRREMGVLPPGDFRNCLIALADSESLMTRLFRYRFGEGTGLDRHSFGNLFITAMAEITGSFERALAESSRVLAVQGRVFPSTLQDVTLVAHLREGGRRNTCSYRVVGESRIPKANGSIERVYLEPEGVPAYPDAVRAILAADIVLAGPGSLYTSVLPNLLVSDIAQAVRANSRAIKIYVCNVATQIGETDHFAVTDHYAALNEHIGAGAFPIVLANDNLELGRNLPEGVEMVRPDLGAFGQMAQHTSINCRLVTADLVDSEYPWRHDPARLGQAVLDIHLSEKRVEPIDAEELSVTLHGFSTEQ